MKDFIMTALPWVCLGVALAVCAVNFNKRKTEKQEHDTCFLLLNPLYLSLLYKFVGGGDMNGILLLRIPDIVVQVFCGVIMLANASLVIKKYIPYTKKALIDDRNVNLEENLL